MTTQIEKSDKNEEKPQVKKQSFRMEHLNKAPPMIQTPPPIPEPEKIGEGI